LDSCSTMAIIAEFILDRVRHGYGKTRGDRVTGITGTGTVLGFGTPRHTVYPYHGITGISRVYYSKVDLIFTFFSHLFLCFFSATSICHTVTQPNMAMPAPHTFSSSCFHHRTPMHSKSYSYN
jgi:hypothetical protein